MALLRQHGELSRVSRHALSRARHQQSLQLYARLRDCRNQGNESGWLTTRTELYDLYEQQALSYGHWIVRKNGLSQADALQECRMALVAAIDRWEPERGELLVLVLYHVRSRMQAFLRREAGIRGTTSSNDNEEQTSCQSGVRGSTTLCLHEVDWLVPDPEDQIEAQLQRVAVRSAVAQLDAFEREAVELRFGLQDGKSHTYREVGTALGVSGVWARHYVARALPRLARLLEGWN